ncbi:MAG: alpha/beta fold hydrolase [Leptospiraceae bacterium]|nr:alpha/beta fold hydrolase [Leptospiraceae bacterium]
MNSRLIPTSGGINLFLTYSDMPEPDAETILFIHGYPDTQISWQRQMDYFRKKYRVAAFDTRGSGKSSSPIDRSGYSANELTNDVQTVIDFLVGKEGKVHLVGHDWGSIISWTFLSTGENQKRVFSFSAVTCPHPMMFYRNVFGKLFSLEPNRIAEGGSQLVRSFYILLFQLPFLPEFLWETFTKEIWSIILEQGDIPEDDPMRKLTPEEILARTKNSVNLYREAMQGGVVPLPKNPFDVPISVFIPEDDVVLTPELYDGMESYVKNLKTYRIQANHWVHKERPDWFNKSLEEFLKFSVRGKSKTQ